MIHFAGTFDRAGDGIDAIDGITGIGDDVTVHQNGAAHCIGIEALADLVRPVEAAVLCGIGNGCICHTVVFVISPEIGPEGGHFMVNGIVDGCFCQCPADLYGTALAAFGNGIDHFAVSYHQGIRVIPGDRQGAGFSCKACLTQHIAVGITLAQGESIPVGPQSLS